MWRYLSRNDAAPRIAGISHRMIIIQKQKDFVIDVGQVIYQHRHDRMRMEQAIDKPSRPGVAGRSADRSNG